jgi:hypothetical protein
MKHLLILLLILLCACSSNYSFEIEDVLNYAGANRPELEKVLSHYRHDTLKLKAAEFLIFNMPGHVSYKNEKDIAPYYDAIDSLAGCYQTNNREELATAYQTLFDQFSFKVASAFDAQVITSDFLIDNIDRAFDAWQNGNWATHLTFDDFCEYLLPYKASEYQSQDNWREYLSDTYRIHLQYLPYSAHSDHSAFWACDALNKALKKQMEATAEVAHAPVPIRRLSSLITSTTKKDCDDNAVTSASVMRANGIPVVIDFVPQWPNRRNGHSWCVLLDNAGREITFSSHTLDGVESYVTPPMAKVFRKNFAINPALLELNQSEKFIPDLFRSLCYKDVTANYQRTDDVTIELENHSGKYAYLATFNDIYWTPIHWGKISGRKALFKQMGRDVVYLPVCMTENGMMPVARPFLLTLKGEVKPIKPDTTQRQTLTLYRKHPTFRFSAFEGFRVLGGRIQAANRADFNDAVTLHTISLYGTASDEIKLNDLTAYRYWRYHSPKDYHCNIAELYFFQQGELITNRGKIIGTADAYPDYSKKAVFDNDPLTFYNATASDSWVGLDFGEPVHIDRILYVPRSDGNCVTFGDEYELKYWDNNGWQSLGRKTADNIFVTFENCPTGALFLLHDCTRGIEDRIFTYENGKQVWW